MEKKYFEGFEGLKVPYLFFESERGEKFKNSRGLSQDAVLWIYAE